MPLVRLCFGPLAVGFTRLSGVWPVDGCALLGITKKLVVAPLAAVLALANGAMASDQRVLRSG
jgi:hypothetical protein